MKKMLRLQSCLHTSPRECVNRTENGMRAIFILNSQPFEHTQAVKRRIDHVAQMKDATNLTQGLFSLSKETAVQSSKLCRKERWLFPKLKSRLFFDSCVESAMNSN
ncbi:hypothetical protein JOM56_015632 [Amanita muscaria]